MKGGSESTCCRWLLLWLQLQHVAASEIHMTEAECLACCVAGRAAAAWAVGHTPSWLNLMMMDLLQLRCGRTCCAFVTDEIYYLFIRVDSFRYQLHT
jgi:hypothetical protein